MLLIVTQKNLSSIDYYRMSMLDGDVISYTEVNWWNVPKYDTVLVMRPIKDVHFRACQVVKEFGKRLIVDYDDNMFDLPEGYAKEEDRLKIAEWTRRSLELADLCICSTNEIHRVYNRFCDTAVRRNMFNDRIFKFDPVLSENGAIGFRGTPRVHAWNTRAFRGIFEGDWVFWGGGMELFGGKHVRELPFIDYMVSLRNNSPALIVKPLIDIPHNRAKSNCTWLEATYAGAACLAPDWEEWQEDGIEHYSDPADCKYKIKEIMGDAARRKEMFERSVKTIKERFLVSVAFHSEDYGL